MLGWLADLFRLVWGLLYWNIRKSWFRFRRGRSACPCQSPSDSGRAFETGCEACLHWHQPKRFRRVCPLLVDTPHGVRCSVDTANVRPFWGRALAAYGGALGTFYLVAVLGVFGFLRTVGYPVSVIDVALPPLWPRLAHARAYYFFEQSKRAFEAGKGSEGLLYLANAYEFDPSNYNAGITLAKNYQVGQPTRADEVFERLLRDHPDKRSATAQDWFRALLARGSFEKIATLARAQILADPPRAHVWLRALLFAVRQSGNVQPLRDLLADSSPNAVTWHPVLATELLIRTGRLTDARAALDRPWTVTGQNPRLIAQAMLVYRVSSLIALRDAYAALDLLDRHRNALDAEAHITLRLDALAAGGGVQSTRLAAQPLLAQRANLATIKILCAQLIRHPDAELFRQLCAQVDREPPHLDSDTAGIWFSLLCTAGAVGDIARLHTLTEQLKQASATPFHALVLVEAFFRGQTAERRITSVLPFLPLPTEVNYALIERFAPPQGGVTLNTSPKK